MREKIKSKNQRIALTAALKQIVDASVRIEKALEGIPHSRNMVTRVLGNGEHNYVAHYIQGGISLIYVLDGRRYRLEVFPTEERRT